MAADNKALTQAKTNADFLRYSFEQPIAANAQNGNTYATGTNLNFDFPIVAGAYAERIQIDYNVGFTYTPAGASPFATVNASCVGGGYGLFQEASITYGNRQVTMHPYISKLLQMTRGYNRQIQGEVLSSQTASIQSALYSAPAINSGANTWKGSIEIPLNAIHPLSPYGLIPMGGSGTRGQLQLVPTVAFNGADPLLSCVNTNGTITSLTGTVTVTIWYRDFKSMATPSPLSLDLTGLPTAQVIKLADMNPLTAGSPNYLRITNPYPFAKLFSIVIDGQSSSTFCSATNIQAFRIDAAENSNSGLRVYDNTTGGINNYYKKVRRTYGQDFDDGILMYDALAENSVSASNMEGDAFLNITNGGYPAARIGVQVGTVGNSASTGITPRVVTFGVIRNDVGIH